MSNLHNSSNVISETCQCFWISLEPSSTGQLFMATLDQSNRCALHTANPHNTLLLEPRCANTQQLRSRKSVSKDSGHWASKLFHDKKTNSNCFQCYIFFGSVRVLPKTGLTHLGIFPQEKKAKIGTWKKDKISILVSSYYVQPCALARSVWYRKGKYHDCCFNDMRSDIIEYVPLTLQRHLESARIHYVM